MAKRKPFMTKMPNVSKREARYKKAWDAVAAKNARRNKPKLGRALKHWLKGGLINP